MSCSARLPVYTMLIALVVPNKDVWGFFNVQGLVMMGLYLMGIVAALVVSYVAKKFIHSTEKSFFILELPTYRAPRWKNIAITMVSKARIFVRDAGKVIIVISMILWALSSYGPPGRMHAVANKYAHAPASEMKNKNAALLENSYAGILGRTIEPVIKPLGYDWKIGIALITSFAARKFLSERWPRYIVWRVAKVRIRKPSGKEWLPPEPTTAPKYIHSQPAYH